MSLVNHGRNRALEFYFGEIFPTRFTFGLEVSGCDEIPALMKVEFELPASEVRKQEGFGFREQRQHFGTSVPRKAFEANGVLPRFLDQNRNG
jgi:hypothetical protein